jgi:hypothetical protein
MNLEEIKARCEAATGGPWIIHPQRGCAEGDLGIFTRPETGYGLGVIWGSLAEYEDNAENNAEFIAHAREDVPALVDEVERLRSQLDALWDRTERASYYVTQEYLRGRASDKG